MEKERPPGCTNCTQFQPVHTASIASSHDFFHRPLPLLVFATQPVQLLIAIRYAESSRLSRVVHCAGVERFYTFDTGTDTKV